MTEQVLQRMREALSAADYSEVRSIVEAHHPGEMADHLEFLDTDELRQFSRMVDDRHLVLIMEELDDFAQANLAKVLRRQRLVNNLQDMAPDEAADLLLSVGEDVADELLNRMKTSDAESVRELMQYPPDSAGGIMTHEYMSLRANIRVDEALRKVRDSSETDVETIYYLYVCDEDDRLVGVLSLRELLGSNDEDTIADVMDDDVISVSVHEDQEEVAQALERYGFLALPVVEDDLLVGIVTFDDVIATIEEETTEDIFRQSGISVTELTRSERIIQAPLMQILMLRLPWLLIVLVGGLIAGGVIGQYEQMLESILILAFFIPVIMDMGGNVGTQTSTIFVRGIVLGHIDREKVLYYMLRETATGLTIGFFTGVGAGLVATLWHGDVMVGLVVAIAMMLTCAVASLVGFGVPWIMHRIGADPAAASNPFITTIKDISGLLIYFGIATLLLGHLL